MGEGAKENVLLDSLAMLAAEGLAIYGDKPDPSRPGPARLEDIQRAHNERGTAALCLSGGGIRSAAFALGVVQGLSRRGILKRFQYLSTVSGGGYTGSLISAWAYRAAGGIKEVEDRLNTRVPPETEEEKRRDPVRWLRKYTNYLSPHLGVLSADTWTLAMIYIRNLLANWLVLLPGLCALAAIPLLVGAVIVEPLWEEPSLSRGAGAAGMAAIVIALCLLRARLCALLVTENRYRGFAVHRSIVVLLFIGATLIGIDSFASQPGYDRAVLWIGPIVSAVILLGEWLAGRKRPPAEHLLLVIGVTLVAIFGVIATWLWVKVFPALIPENFGLPPDFSDYRIFQRLFVVLFVPVGLALLMLPEALMVVVAATLGDDYDREWWSRAVALLLGIAAVWVVIGSLVLLAAMLLALVWDIAGSYVNRGGIVAALVALGAFLARRSFKRSSLQESADVPKADATELPKPATLASRYGLLTLNAFGIVFIALVIAGIGAFADNLVALVSGAGGRPGEIDYRALDAAKVLIAATALAYLLSLFVPINKFSLHAMYRDRLSRAFLASSRWQRPLPDGLAPGPQEEKQFENRREDEFTEFDRFDSPLMRWLDPTREGRRGAALTGEQHLPPEPGKPAPQLPFVQAPFHVINCALNLVGDNKNTELAERKAESFIITPLHAGCHRLSYRKTEHYGGEHGLSLATAMTISGAAVSPNAGYHSTRVMTFIMTLFNARLGWWLGNPQVADASQRDGPRTSLVSLFKELFGLTRGAGRWVFLSDGGHFDNLGLYEMVRRGCRYIVAIDASADPFVTFDDLGNAIRKIRIDFGIEIKRRELFLIGGRDRGLEGRYAALFDIIYPHGDSTRGRGTLVYIKPAIYRRTAIGEPIDVVEYASRSGSFPHEPTADQFYLESQFESYRALGEYEIESIVKDFASAPVELAEAARMHVRETLQRPPGVSV